MFKENFRSWSIEKGFNSEAIDKYPLLIGIFRNKNGDFVFERLSEGARITYKPAELIQCLNAFKSKFENSEQELEKAKVKKRSVRNKKRSFRILHSFRKKLSNRC